jgi:hypothetical protein
MNIRCAVLVIAVFLTQLATNVGYFTILSYKALFGISTVVIPIVGYSLAFFWLPRIRKMHVAIRTLVAFSVSIPLWYIGGMIILVLLLMTKTVGHHPPI